MRTIAPFIPLLVLCGGLLLGHGHASAQVVVVVVNPKASVSSLTADQLASLYLGKSSSLPGGISQAVDLPESNPVREQFYTKSSGRNAAQVKAVWARLAFSGKATPPKEVASSAEVKKLVASNPEAIGYIEKSALDGSVKAVLTLD